MPDKEYFVVITDKRGYARVVGPAREGEAMEWRAYLSKRGKFAIQIVKWEGDLLEYEAWLDLK